MVIVIDGYNMMRAIIHKSFIEETDRLWFLKLLNVYAKKKDHHMTVVFDSSQSWPITERYSDLVTVIYTRAGQTADDYIIEKGKAYKSKDMMIVSSDRALRAQVVKDGHSCIGALHFYNLIKETVGKKAAVISSDMSIKKYVEDTDLDELMKAGSGKIPIKEEQTTESRKPQAQKVKKTKRILLKKIKKL